MSSRRSLGFTLVEVVVAIAAFAVAFSFLITVFFPANRASVDPLLEMRSAELAQSYLEEILGKRFDENNTLGSTLRCGSTGAPACSGSMAPDAGETRATYDDVDDYNDFDGLPDIPLDVFGNVRTEYLNYRVLVTVNYAGAEIGVANGDAKRIQVTVISPIGNTIRVTAYRGNF
ncbi:prepilin-type N-terminal cleavage/methylation domain-containing protein [Pleionea sp. CnH1-48]|uniref:prepilin-type N-terminal cleavage/methylation domain-containing protein n=1 Tax=Pleionea sp. CnH1-48 TaxID=2954494 RepID=UPI00209792BC|nr:prepilin-type N-terminal cleavage/methylation domain-containing protein [Pleionea sp. CnH1-48]MCO7226304.1 prepilin-type N-terminal cleavage/methylation domain-containing protein [Pleionea sp. CnH1-48]